MKFKKIILVVLIIVLCVNVTACSFVTNVLNGSIFTMIHTKIKEAMVKESEYTKTMLDDAKQDMNAFVNPKEATNSLKQIIDFLNNMGKGMQT